MNTNPQHASVATICGNSTGRLVDHLLHISCAFAWRLFRPAQPTYSPKCLPC
jgi:hypothetical protein